MMLEHYKSLRDHPITDTQMVNSVSEQSIDKPSDLVPFAVVLQKDIFNAVASKSTR